MKDPTYRAAEKGRRPLHGTILALAVDRFGATSHYLLTGCARSLHDARIHHLVMRLDRHAICGYATDPNDVHGRLVHLRRTLGYPSASAAATAMAWKPGRYGEHEARRRSIPLDQAVRYGIAYGGMTGIDYLLFGDAV